MTGLILVGHGMIERRKIFCRTEETRLDRGDATWSEPGALAVHRGRASVGANVGGAIGANAVSEKLARSSPGAGGESQWERCGGSCGGGPFADSCGGAGQRGVQARRI